MEIGDKVMVTVLYIVLIFLFLNGLIIRTALQFITHSHTHLRGFEPLVSHQISLWEMLQYY